MIETHPLLPFLPNHAKLLLLGSFPPPKNRWKMNFYYPNFNNDMWRIFGLIFFQNPNYFLDVSNKTFKEALLKDFLNEQGIAIYDVAYQIKRLQGNAYDKDLEIIQPIHLEKILEALPNCQNMVTTGELATQTLLSLLNVSNNHLAINQPIKIEFQKRFFNVCRLPSTSRAYPLKLEKKAEYYLNYFQSIQLI